MQSSMILKSFMNSASLTLLLLQIIFWQSVCFAQKVSSNEQARPNILLIMADDLGYSDIGSYGSEISTPTLDELANNGLQYTNFYSGALCSPSRAMLLSGVDNHIAGLGNMVEIMTANQIGKLGYEGYLNERVYSVASLIKSTGYHTYMAGKWHLGTKPEHRPKSRGFEKTFALLEGSSGHFDNRGFRKNDAVMSYVKNGELIKLPKNFFSSRSYTDETIRHIENNRHQNKPFFAYLAYTAPHWPLQVTDDYLDRYAGKYDSGYNKIRDSRLQKLKHLGVVKEDFEMTKILGQLMAWEKQSPKERKKNARKMEIYAAMIDNLDHHIGRLFDYLKTTKQYENTLIIFLSDNGPSGISFKSQWIKDNFNNQIKNMGKKGSFVSYGSEWAQVSSTPFRGHKAHQSEGGIRVPLIIKPPNYKGTKQLIDNIVTIRDIAPTLLEIANVKKPFKQIDKEKQSPSGKSFLSTFSNPQLSIHNNNEVFAWEVHGRRAIRQSNKKMILSPKPIGNGEWQLYDLAKDPGEVNDVKSAKQFSKFEDLWKEYVSHVGVVDPLFVKSK